MSDDLDCKNIYLRKGSEIVGLHAVGHKGPYECVVKDLDGTESLFTSDFMELEKWGNVYNEKHEMLGRGSFRIFSRSIEHEAKEFEAEGWENLGPIFPVRESK